MNLTLRPHRPRLTAVGLILAAAIVVGDQVLKWWIVSQVMAPPRVIPVTGFFNLVLTWNRGVSFGLFADGAAFVPFVLIAVAAGIGCFLMVWLWSTERAGMAVCLGLVLGGAIGNMIDRWRFGAVVDFLDFHLAGWHWPAFNLADSAITIGVTLIVIDTLLGHERT